MKTKDLIEEAISLPVEERTIIVDSLLRSLNTPESEIDEKWAAVAKRRLGELRSGKVEAVPGKEVFKKGRDIHCGCHASTRKAGILETPDIKS